MYVIKRRTAMTAALELDCRLLDVQDRYCKILFLFSPAAEMQALPIMMINLSFQATA